MSGALLNKLSIYFFESSKFFYYLEQTAAKYRLSIWFGSFARFDSNKLSASTNLVAFTASVALDMSNLFCVIYYVNEKNSNFSYAIKKGA